jgi:site-specific recombinase
VNQNLVGLTAVNRTVFQMLLFLTAQLSFLKEDSHKNHHSLVLIESISYCHENGKKFETEKLYLKASFSDDRKIHDTFGSLLRTVVDFRDNLWAGLNSNGVIQRL